MARDLVSAGIRTLLELQRVDRRLELLRRELEQRPRMHSVKRERLASLEEKRREIHGMQLDVQKRIDRVELDVKSIVAKIEENRSRLANASTNPEYQGYLAQIARLEMDRSRVDDQLLELWEELEQTKALEAECARAIAEQNGIVAEEAKELETELGSIRQEARKLLAGREKAREPVPAELLEVYDSLYARYQDRSIVPVEGGICGGCHMSLSPQILADLKGTKPVHCNNCRRLLYPA